MATTSSSARPKSMLNASSATFNHRGGQQQKPQDHHIVHTSLSAGSTIGNSRKSSGECPETARTGELLKLQKQDSKPRMALQRLRRVRVGSANAVHSGTPRGNDVEFSEDTVSVTSSAKFRLSSSQGKRRTSMHPKLNDISGLIHNQYGHLEKTYTKGELQEYQQLFNMFDTDNSGAIGNDELKEAISSIGLKVSKSEIENLIKEIDEDGNGEIDFEEFCHCMKKSQDRVKSTNEEIIRQCFDIFDQDGNGIITESEFIYVAKEIGGFSQELAESVFNELDISSAGHLSADQFGAIVEDYLLLENARSS